jgi:putative ABC transport system permease protein
MIAWLQLKHQKIRFLTGVAGVTFAVILMLMQFGFQAALFDSSTRLHNAMDGDLFIIDRKTNSITGSRQFARSKLYQALGDPAVRSVSPIYIARGSAKHYSVEQSRPLLVVGINPERSPFAFSDIGKLKHEGTVLFDKGSRAEFGVSTTELSRASHLRVENKRLQIVGWFNVGISFGADGNCLTSTTTFTKLFPNRKLGTIDVGVIKLRDQALLSSAQQDLQSRLGDHVRVLTRQEFIGLEQAYWRTSTAIGFIFKIGVALGIVVGGIIVYQILYADISDHLREYATLLAIGYPMRFLTDIVFQEAVILAVVGFVPGLLIAFKLYEVTAIATKLPMQLDAARAVLALSLTVVMCCIAAAISSARLRNADPADVFSGG